MTPTDLLDRPNDVLDEILDEEQAARRREETLFGIGPFPHPENLTTKNGTLIPAWWRFRDLPRRKGHGPHLVITSTDATWLGLANTPALLRGYGAITAEQARHLGAKPDQITILIFPTTCPHPHPPDTHQPTAEPGPHPGNMPSGHGTSLTHAPGRTRDKAPGDGNTPTAGPHNCGPGNKEPGTGGPRNGEPGTSRPGTGRPGTGRPGDNRPDRSEPGDSGPGDGEPPQDSQECAHNQDHTTEQATRYRPSRSLTDLIAAILPTCTFPHCSRPATHCDMDHLKPFSKGGSTCVCNLRPACRRHHQLKTTGQWQARPTRSDEPHPAGTTIWTSPDGQPYPSTPFLPGQPGWTANDFTNPQALSMALRKALEDREVLPVKGNQSASPNQPVPTLHDLSREDVMPAAQRSRLRQERWRKDLQRHTHIRPHHQTERKDHAQNDSQIRPDEGRTGPQSTPQSPFRGVWPSTTAPVRQTEDPPF